MNKEIINLGLETYRWYGPNIGGVEKTALMLANNLANNGHNISIFTEKNDKNFNGNQSIIEAKEGDLKKISVYYHQNMDEVVGNIERQIQEGKIDIVEIEGFFGIKEDISLMKRILNLKAPLVWVSHNVSLLNKRHRYDEPGFVFSKAFTDKVDAFVCVSSLLGQHAREFGFPNEKIKVIYNPINTEIFHSVSSSEKTNIRNKLGLPLDKKIILYNGRVALDKGSDFLMRAWQEASCDLQDHHLVIVGDVSKGDESMAELFAKFKASSGGNVTFSDGFIRDEQTIANYYQAADIFLLPSPSEGMSGSMIEAMACELPCVVSEKARAESGSGELLDDGYNGTTFKELTPNSFVAAIKEVKNSMGRASLFKFKSMGFEIQDSFKKRVDLYSELVHGKPYSVAMVA